MASLAKVAALKAEIHSLKENYSLLVAHVPSSDRPAMHTADHSSTSTFSKHTAKSNPLPDKAMYPDVKFWDCDDWETYKQDLKKAGIHTEDTQQAPATWSGISSEALMYYQDNMYKVFSYLACCADHWKVEYLAVINYPSWHHNLSKSGMAIKVEPSEPRMNQDSASPLQTIPEGTKKRKHDPVSMPSQPQMKTAKKDQKNKYVSSKPPVLDTSSNLQASDASNAPALPLFPLLLTFTALVPLAPHIHCPPSPETPEPVILMQQDRGLPPTNILTHFQSSKQEVPTMAQAPNSQATPMLLLTNITTPHTSPTTAALLVPLLPQLLCDQISSVPACTSLVPSSPVLTSLLPTELQGLISGLQLPPDLMQSQEGTSIVQHIPSLPPSHPEPLTNISSEIMLIEPNAMSALLNLPNSGTCSSTQNPNTTMSAVVESYNHTNIPSNVLLPEKHPDSRKIIREFKDPFGRAPVPETPWQPEDLLATSSSHTKPIFPNQTQNTLPSSSTPEVPTAVKIKQEQKKGTDSYYYPNKTSNSAINIFLFDFCPMNPKCTRAALKEAYEQLSVERKTFYINQSAYNRKNHMTPGPTLNRDPGAGDATKMVSTTSTGGEGAEMSSRELGGEQASKQ
ncbi:hypothetical protein K439DRAFT_1539696 [Ramaria rubella]|nr:hypothetical protein K439DRAFT_1539696 [Ramaria rubella]